MRYILTLGAEGLYESLELLKILNIPDVLNVPDDGKGTH